MGGLCCAQEKVSIPIHGEDRRTTNVPSMKNFTELKKITNIRDHYVLDKKPLGEGSFGTVYRAKIKAFGTPCALKVIKKEKLQSNPELPKLMIQEL